MVRNLLYLMADEWRASAVGLLGMDPVLTPHIDALARGGVLCGNAVSTDPVCSPHRAMLMSGQYAPTNGVTRNCNSQAPQMGLDPEVACFSDVLAEAGYQCGYLGKWHLDPPTPDDERYGEGRRRDGRVWDTWTPPHRRHGFAFWYAYGCCDRHLAPHYWRTGADRSERTDVAQWSPEHETDVAVGFLRSRDRARPFALVVSYNPPHMPFHEVPGRYRDLYAGADPHALLRRPNVDLDRAPPALTAVADYFAAITGIDDQIGRLTAELRRQGLLEDTLIVVTSDHGEALGSQGLMGKRTWFAESLLVPLIWHLPGVLAARDEDLIVSTPDLHPTLLGLLDLPERIPATVQGRDLSAALRAEPGAFRPEFALYAHLNPTDATGVARGVRTDRWTYAVRGEDLDRPGPGGVHLYDHDDDPFEMVNLASRASRVEADLDDLLRAELRRCGYPVQPGEGSLR